MHVTMLGVAVLAAAAPGEAGLSLHGALVLARDHSQRVAAQEAEVEAAELRVTQSWARLLPRVTLTARYSRVNLVEPPALEVPVRLPNQPAPVIRLGEGYEQVTSLGVLVEQPVFTGGALWAQRQSARAARQAATQALADAEQDLALRTEEAFLRVLRVRALEAVARKSEAVLTEHVTRVERLFQAGSAMAIDLSRARARLAAARVQRLQAQAGTASAELTLASLVGLEPDALGQLDDRPPVRPPLPESPAARPDVQVARALAAVKDAQVAAASAPLLPQVGLRFGANYDNPNQRFFPWRREFNLSWDASVVASWTVLDFGVAWLGREAAQAEARAAKLKADAADEGAQLELAARRLEAGTMVERIAAAEVAAAAAGEALARAQRLCEAGQAPCLGVLDAQAEAARSEAELVGARLDARLADAALYRAAGALFLPHEDSP